MKIPDYVKNYVEESNILKQRLIETQIAVKNGKITKKVAYDRCRQISADGRALLKQSEAFANAIDSLPDEQQSVLYMKCINGMGMATIAKTMGCSLPTALKFYGKALENLKERGD